MKKLIAAGLVVIASLNPMAALENIPSNPKWIAFEQSLTGLAPEQQLEVALKVETLTRDSDYKHAFEQKNEAFFLEMMRQKDSAYVRAAGFAGMAKLRPERSLEMAFNLVLDNQPTPSILLFPALSTIENAKFDNTFAIEFGRAAYRASDNLMGFALIMEAIPEQVMDGWFHFDAKPAIPQFAEAQVLVSLVEFYEASKKPISPLMRSTLLGFKVAKSASANFAYLYAIEEDTESYRLLLINILQSAALNETEFLTLLVKRKKFISEHFKTNQLALSDSRAKTFQRVIFESRNTP
jgi:hypothetical protein